MVKKRGCGGMRRENVASGRRDRNANINCEVHVDFGGGRQREKVAWWLVVVEDEEERKRNQAGTGYSFGMFSSIDDYGNYSPK